MSEVQTRWQTLRKPRPAGELDLSNPRGDLPRDRLRTGLVLLISGVVLLVSVLGIGTLRLRSQLVDAAVGSTTSLDPASREFSFKVYLFLIIAGGLLLLLLLFASYALIRSNRRYLDLISAKPPKPTDTTDVWAMHRLPDDEPTIIDRGDDETTDPDIREDR